ncbi:CrcB-like protein-domain-containing protein [Gongronella butleri]|nr:CrcB-like protein-domain-containing protein [Gongronella butleri]
MDPRAEQAEREAADAAVEIVRRDSALLRHPPDLTVYEKKLIITFMIIPFAIAGVLIRVALQRLQTYAGAPVFALVYAQWVGCFIMGMATVYKNDLFFLYHPVHVGVATGLCGSITTFSSWQWGIFGAFANIAGDAHPMGKNVLAAISELLVTLAMSLNGYRTGRHAAFALQRLRNKHRAYRRSRQRPPLHKSGENEENDGENENSTPVTAEHGIDIQYDAPPVPKMVSLGFSLKQITLFDQAIVLFGIVSWVAVVIAAAVSPYQRDLSLACVFAPVGALLRWRLSFYNGSAFYFPAGTLAANLFGTLILAIIYLLRYSVQMSTLSCLVLTGLADGFCGCLTTISTFVVELTILPHRQAYAYGTLSVVVGQAIMFLVVGPFIWTHGIELMCAV